MTAWRSDVEYGGKYGGDIPRIVWQSGGDITQGRHDEVAATTHLHRLSFMSADRCRCRRNRHLGRRRHLPVYEPPLMALPIFHLFPIFPLFIFILFPLYPLSPLLPCSPPFPTFSFMPLL